MQYLYGLNGILDLENSALGREGVDSSIVVGPWLVNKLLGAKHAGHGCECEYKDNEWI